MFTRVRQPFALALELLCAEERGAVNCGRWDSLTQQLGAWLDCASATVAMLEAKPRHAHGVPASAYVDATNAALAALQRDLVAMFRSLFVLLYTARIQWPDADRRATCLYRHCHPKSEWLASWEGDCYWKVTPDGSALESLTLGLHPGPARRVSGEDLTDLWLCTVIDLRQDGALTARTSLHALFDIHAQLLHVLEKHG